METLGTVIGVALAAVWLLGWVVTLWAKHARTGGFSGIDLQAFLFIWPAVLAHYFVDTRRANARLEGE